jgi:hypothetical protein
MVGFFVPLLFHNSIDWMTQPPQGKEKKLRTLPVDIWGREEERESKREIFLKIYHNI